MNLAVITWLWGNRFSPADVEKLYEGFKRHYKLPFRFFCVNDKAHNFKAPVVSVPMPPKFCDMYALRCYRRLSLFNPEYGLKFGERILQLDLDIAIVGDITQMFNVKDDFKIWECPSRGKHHGRSATVKNPTVMFFNPSFTQEFYNAFLLKSHTMIAKAKRKYHGSDQGLISHYFRACPTWTAADGIYSYRDNDAVKKMTLPKNAKIISFHGPSVSANKMKVFNGLRK